MANYFYGTGNLTRDVEVKATSTGMSVANFTVAITTKTAKDKEETLFLPVTVFDKLANVCAEHIGKGSKVLVCGRMCYQEWDKDGSKFHRTYLIAQSVEFLGSRGGESSQRHEDKKSAANKAKKAADESDFGDDVPF